MNSETYVRFPSTTDEFRVRHTISESYRRFPSPTDEFEQPIYLCVVSCPDHASRNAGVKQWFGDETNACMYCCIVGCVFGLVFFLLFHFSTKGLFMEEVFFLGHVGNMS